MTTHTDQVAGVLHDAAETHHQVYRIVDGTDPDWASWYADWLIHLSPLPTLLGTTPVRSELVWLLVDLDKRHTTDKPANPWEQFYAQRLLTHFADQASVMTVSVSRVPCAGAHADELVAILHDAEEDDERIRAALRDPTCQTYAALVADELVGAAVVRWDPPDAGEILYLAVAPHARGRGYGRPILAVVQAELPAHGRRLLVGTDNSSLDNIAFYQKCGFRMSAVKRDFFDYIDPPIQENGIIMRDMIVFSDEAA